MLKASALYMVIVIALVIGLLCSALITVAYFYRLQYQKVFRQDQLQNNLSSGVNILLTSEDNNLAFGKVLSLFGGSADSIYLKKVSWGVYDIGISKAFIQGDTLYKTFSMASVIDSVKWSALYVPDEDRPVSVSGKTMIKGDAFLPKAGIQGAYVDGKSYKGDKRIVNGKIRFSEKTMPALNAGRLAELEKYFNQSVGRDTTILRSDSVYNSFLGASRVAGFGKNVGTIAHIKLSGNIILVSDTTIIIDQSAELNNIMIFAPAIIVKKGFHGTCQLFATDSIGIERDCIFDYPSSLAVMCFKSSTVGMPGMINIGENTNITGYIFSYDKNDNPNRQPLISLGKNTRITGQIYSQGLLGLKDGVVINGSVFTGRFLYQSSFTRYENYIINTTINSKGLSPYFLSSDLMPVSEKRKRVLQWLEAN